jgi:hypothetical protein
MLGGHRGTGILHRRILLALRVNLLRFVEIVPALAVIPLGTRAKATPSRSRMPSVTQAIVSPEPHAALGQVQRGVSGVTVCA